LGTISLVKLFCSQTILTVNFSGHISMYEAELAVFVESFSSSSGTHMGSKYSLSHAIFSETVYTVENQIQGPG
jgi:hypothetical protein